LWHHQQIGLIIIADTSKAETLAVPTSAARAFDGHHKTDFLKLKWIICSKTSSPMWLMVLNVFVGMSSKLLQLL